MTTTLTFSELTAAAGKDLGYSNWVEITQERISTFADATDDHQWIHTDVEKAKEGPFGGPIAPTLQFIGTVPVSSSSHV